MSVGPSLRHLRVEFQVRFEREIEKNMTIQRHEQIAREILMSESCQTCYFDAIEKLALLL